MSIYSKKLSRRDLLTLLSISILPVSSLATRLQSNTVRSLSKRLKKIKFKGMAAPSINNPAEMATVTVNSALQVTLDNGQLIDYALDYQPFFMTGTRVPDGSAGTILAGGYYDINNQPIIDTTVKNKERQFFSDCPDGTSLLQLSHPTVKDNTVFAVVQFEYTSFAQDGKTMMYGQLPSPIAVLTLDQDLTTGHLKLLKYHNIDTASIYGLWITCGSSLSPWNTHLSSEEYEPDAFELVNNPEQATVLQGFSQHLFGNKNTANPYHYGHIPEVTVNPDGTGQIKKHYCMGRFSHELVQVMPDNRTVLMGDDATNAGLFVFIADKPTDLSAGTLYVAQLGEGFSIDSSNKNTTHLSWIKLGSAHSDDILNLANRLKPSDIMTVKTIDPQDNAYTKITVNGKVEWVVLHKNMAHAAAFLETHRYAALMGGSLGFSKMEGTTINTKDKVAYQALQNIHSSMVSGHKANVSNNGINLPKAINAGAILHYDLRGNVYDTEGVAINSHWMPVNIGTLLVGQDITPDAMGNTANPDWIANPDNLKFSETLRTLFIGEDSTQHINSYLWAYNVDTQDLARLASMPAGAEATGLHIADNINGWMYILSNFQHAGDWSSIHQPFKNTLDPLLKNNYQDKFSATVGYLTCKII